MNFFVIILIFFSPLGPFSDIEEWLGKILLEFHWHFSVFTLFDLSAGVMDLLGYKTTHSDSVTEGFL